MSIEKHSIRTIPRIREDKSQLTIAPAMPAIGGESLKVASFGRDAVPTLGPL